MLTRFINQLRQRVRVIDTVMTVNERVGVVGGGPLAANIAMSAFLSLFPLMLVGIAVLGWFSDADTDFAREAVDSLGLEGKAADTVLGAIQTAERSRNAATIVGLLGFAWSGLGVVGAVEGALDAVWQVRGRGITGKVHHLAWLLGAGALLIASLTIGPLLNVLPGPAIVASLAFGLVLDVLLFLWTFQKLNNAPVPLRAYVPGAIVGGIGLTVLKFVGGVYVPKLVADSSALYGSIGVVFALLAWLLLGAKLVVYSAAYNVVRYERHYGTVTVEIEVPRIEGHVPLDATRGGAIASSASPPPAPG